MMTRKNDSSKFSLVEWGEAMAAAVDDIDQAGRKLLATHRTSSDRAEEVCRNWQLEERQAEQRLALEALFSAGKEILVLLDTAEGSLEPGAMIVAASCIDRNLPLVETAFLTVRHCAQDMLHWADRHGKPEHVYLTDDYRALHGELTAYAPVFKPRLEAFQMKLVELAKSNESSAAVTGLLSAITRYNAVLDSARRFVAAVVEPPLELVFAETDVFLQDLRQIPVEIRGVVASELNDCCRSVLYEPEMFANAVAPVPMEQPDGIDSSLVLFESHGIRVLMTVEEDPLFGQMTVHLLRAVNEEKYDKARIAVIEALSDEWR